MLSEVRAAFPAFSDRFEGYCPYPYTDIVGLLTVGRGNLIDGGLRRESASDPTGPPEFDAAITLPFEIDGAPASKLAIMQGCFDVKHAWPHIQSVGCAAITKLRLPPAAVDALTFQTLDRMWASCVAYFPDVEDWVAPAQLGLLSMCWAAGGAFEIGFPKFDAAAHTQDWNTCAVECLMLKPPVPTQRNAMNVRLFKAAAVGTSLSEVLST